jgi:hypothetical protein
MSLFLKNLIVTCNNSLYLKYYHNINILDGNQFKVKNIFALYNPNLIHSFISNYQKMNERFQSNPDVFYSKVLPKTHPKERQFIQLDYENRIDTLKEYDLNEKFHINNIYFEFFKLNK